MGSEQKITRLIGADFLEKRDLIKAPVNLIIAPEGQESVTYRTSLAETSKSSKLPMR